MTATTDAYGPQVPPSGGGSVSRLYATALYLWVGATGSAFAGFIFWALVARLYNAQDVGLASAALAVLALLCKFSHLGLGLGLIRFLPESGARGPRLANAVFTSSAALAAALSVVFLAGVPLWTPSLGFLREQPLYPVAFVLFAVLSTLSLIQTQAFMAARKAQYILIQAALIQLSRLALPALMVVFFGAIGIVLSVGIAAGLGAVVGFALLTRGLAGYRPAPTVDVGSVAKLLPFSAANYVADLLLLGPGLVLPLLVVALLGSAEGAYFYMAWFLGYLLTSASGHLAISLFAEGSHDPRSLLVLSRNALAGGLAVAIAGAALLALVGDKVLLVFGHDYASEGATLLRMVALAAIPAAVVNVYLGALRVTERVGELVTIAGLMAATTMALSCVFLPVMGLEGAGVGHILGQGLGLTFALGRLLANIEGTVAQRMRRLLVTLAARS
jgi:O-antigen/teichoic acid export membrane protein